MSADKPSFTWVPVSLRLPKPIAEQLSKEASANERSLAAEIRVAIAKHLGAPA